MKQLQSTSQDIYYYKPLHIWAKMAGFLPLFDINRLTDRQPPNWNGIIMGIFFVAIFFYGSYGKVCYMWYVFPPSVFVTDVGGDVCMFITNIASISRLCFFKGRQICTFLKMLKRIDADLRGLTTDLTYPRRIFLVEFVLANLLFVVYYIYDFAIWCDSITWDTYRWYFLRDLQCFQVVILSLVMRNYALAIRNRIRLLNELLRQKQPSQDLHFNPKNSKTKMRSDHWHIVKMRKIFASICRSIEVFNDIFGWMYLILYVCIVVYILTASNIGLVYGVGDRVLGTSEFGFAMLMLCVIWCMLPLIIGFFIFSSADNCIYEFRRTPWICYAIVDELASIDEKNILIPELEKFAQQVNISQPEITAAGWFTVNYTIFFALIGSLSSYFIVLIQFM